MADPIVFSLSSIDQSSIRVYIRYALCYPCDGDNASVTKITDRLTSALKRGVSYMPILAGKVYPVPAQADSADSRRHSLVEYSTRQYPLTVQRRATVVQDASNEQRGRLEVRVTLDEVNAFKPTFKTLGKDEFPHDFATLSQAGMPPNALIGDAFTPLPDKPEDSDGGSPVFAMQANFISGGVIVAIYLHHSVAGVQGLVALLRCMSVSEEVLPGRPDLTTDEIRGEALEQSRLRDRLSGARGYQANLDEHPIYKPLIDSNAATKVAPIQAGEPTCKVLAFSLRMLDAARDLANERHQEINADPVSRISRFDCMISILWKTLSRARWPFGAAIEGQTSALVIPISIRKRLEPGLDGSYYGNCDVFSYTQSTISRLSVPLDIIEISNTALSVRRGFSSLTEARVRSAIAIINECEDVRSVNHPCIDSRSDVFMTNWTDIPVREDTTLGMGIGAALWARKLSSEHSNYDCVLLPLSGDHAWEVMVSLPEPEMKRLLEDPGLERFLIGHV